MFAILERSIVAFAPYAVRLPPSQAEQAANGQNAWTTSQTFNHLGSNHPA